MLLVLVLVQVLLPGVHSRFELRYPCPEPLFCLCCMLQMVNVVQQQQQGVVQASVAPSTAGAVQPQRTVALVVNPCMAHAPHREGGQAIDQSP